MRPMEPYCSTITWYCSCALTVIWSVFVLITADPAHSEDGVRAKPGDEIIVEFKKKKKRARVRTVNITMDLNNDGRIDDRDDRIEGNLSSIVICDRDNVYVYQKNEDKLIANDEPARRQLMIVQNENPTLGGVTLQRSSKSLRVFRSESGGEEVAFRGNRSGGIGPGRYWVQGGSNCSLSIGDEFLRAMPAHWVGNRGNLPTDQIDLTVMWVDIEAREAGPRDTMLKSPIYGHFDTVKKAQGHSFLGVHRSTLASEDTNRKVRAVVEIHGIVMPSKKFSSNVFGRELAPLRHDNRRASTEFGFIFRRWAKPLLWVNGSKSWGAVKVQGWPLAPELIKDPANMAKMQFVPDDSHPAHQDTFPNVLKEKYLIVDNDGPGLPIPKPGKKLGDRGTSNFYHFRSNFVEYVVFKLATGKPQRVSKRMKWAAALDFGRDFQDRAVFISSRPNMGNISEKKFSNAVFANQHLPLEALIPNLKIPEIKEIKLISVDGDKRTGNEIPRASTVTLQVTGKYLIGKFRFVTAKEDFGNTWIEQNVNFANLGSMHEVTRLKADESGIFSDTTEARITFRTGLPSGTEVAIMLVNGSGNSNPAGHFIIVDSQ